jgi:hypothetical protein
MKATKIKAILITMATVLISPEAFGAGKAQIEVTGKPQADKRIEFTFKTHPVGDLVINKEGPWKLEIISSGKIKFEKTEYKRTEWKEDVSGFTVLGSATKGKSETIKYKLVAFVCTKDKSQCFREVVEGSSKVSW